MKKQDKTRYLVVFVITLILFLTATTFASFLSGRKLEQLKSIQDKISMDIMSSETQFQLLQELSCRDLEVTTLSSELGEIAEKINYSEGNDKNVNEVTELKKYYSLLQIKDYLLMQKIKEKCGKTVVPIFYFYTTAEHCSECIKQAAVLTELRRIYPELRIYSFDYNLELSALQSLIKIFKIEDTKLPATVIEKELYTGFQSIADIEEALPELAVLKAKREAEMQAAKEEALNIEEE